MFIRSARAGRCAAAHAVVCLVLAACRGSTEPAPGLAPVSAAPAGLAAEVCEVLLGQPALRRAECCRSTPVAPMQACVRAVQRSLDTGRVRIEPGALASCREAVERELDGCAWVTPSAVLPPAACAGLFVGAVPSGGVCHSSLECAAPLHCAGATPSEAGTCSEPLPDGAECSRTSDALASYALSFEIERAHPPCAGRCSFGRGKCRSGALEPAKARPARAGTGEVCSNDFDCAVGGCDASGRCGMKCSVTLDGLGRKASAPALGMRRTPVPRAD